VRFWWWTLGARNDSPGTNDYAEVEVFGERMCSNLTATPLCLGATLVAVLLKSYRTVASTTATAPWGRARAFRGLIAAAMMEG
jgi:hypothetical protein